MATCEEKATAEYQEVIQQIDSDARINTRALLSLYNKEGEIKPKIRELADYGAALPANLIGTLIGGKGKFSEMLLGIGTNLINSDNMAMRGLAAKLFEMPQGGNAVSTTAAVDKFVFRKQMLGAGRGKFNEGFIAHLKEQGKNPAQIFNSKLYNDYKRKVFMQVLYPDPNASKAIKHGADGISPVYEEAFKIRQWAGEAGFEKVTKKENYAPKILDNKNIVNLVAKYDAPPYVSGNGVSTVEEVLYRAYYKDGTGISEQTARWLARGIIYRAKNRTLTMEGAVRALKNSDINAMKRELSKAGMSEEDINQFLQGTLEAEERTHMSDRARRSLDPDLRIEYNGLRASDLFVNDIEALTEGYVREASANAALARKGFKTRNSLEDTILELEKNMKDQGMKDSRIKKEIDMLKGGLEMLYDRPPDVGQVGDSLLKGSAFLRTWASLMRLGNVGLASFPESARTLTDRGLSISFRNMPSLKELGLSSRTVREGGKYSGKYDNPFYENLDFLLRYVGDDHAIDFRGIAMESLEEATSSNFGKSVEHAIAQGQYYQTYTSGFMAIQGGGEKLAARSLLNAIVDDISSGTSKSLSELEIREAGWADGFYDRLLSKKGIIKEVDFEGKKFKVLDWDKMSYEDIHRLRVGMYRTVKRKMQGQFVGETSLWMNQFLGKFITQFRTFAVASLEKQLLRDVKFDKANGSITLATSLAMGAAVHMAYNMARYQGRSDKEKYLEEAFSPMGLSLGAFNRAGQLASLGIGVDALAMAGLMPEELRAAGTFFGARGITPSAIPALSAAQDTAAAVGAPGGLFMHMVTGGEQGYSPKEAMNKIEKVIWPSQIMGIHNAWNYLEHSLED